MYKLVEELFNCYNYFARFSEFPDIFGKSNVNITA